MKRLLSQTWPYLILLFVAIAGLWQVALLRSPMDYDMANQAFPWRFYIGECLQNYHLPLWNPYQHMGYPIHADPQSSAWYPLTWFWGYFFGYNIYVISLDYILHIFLAGTGMLYLSKRLNISREAGLIMAVSYMLSGFFIGNAQHFMWIISGVWIPFILASYLDIYQRRDLLSVLKFSLFVFLLLTGGYPAFAFILVYLLIAVFILFGIKMYRENHRKELLRFALLNLAALGIVLCLSAVLLVGIFYLQPYLIRAEGVTLRQALCGPFYPQSMISFLLPFASSLKDMTPFGSDRSMTNGFFGLILLGSLVLIIFRKKTALQWLFLAWGFLMLLAAFGDYLPVREFLYNHVPGMNYFRFPSLFRYFVILCFVIAGGMGLPQLFEREKPGKAWLAVFSGLMVVVTVLLVYSLGHNILSLSSIFRNEFADMTRDTGLAQHIIFQGIPVLLILAVIILVMTRVSQAKRWIWLLGICIFDLVMAAQMNGSNTVYHIPTKAKQVKKEMDAKLVHGFPLPDHQKLSQHNDRKVPGFGPVWMNLNTFYKNPAYDGYSPFKFKNFGLLEDGLPKLLEASIDHPTVFLSSIIRMADSINTEKPDQAFASSDIYLYKADYENIRTVAMSSSPQDSAVLTGFSPGHFAVRVSSAAPQLLTLLQNEFTGWQADIDTKKARIMKANLSFMTVLVPAGVHEVTFTYHPAGVIIGFYISLVSFLLTVGGIIFLSVKTRKVLCPPRRTPY